MSENEEKIKQLIQSFLKAYHSVFEEAASDHNSRPHRIISASSSIDDSLDLLRQLGHVLMKISQDGGLSPENCQKMLNSLPSEEEKKNLSESFIYLGLVGTTSFLGTDSFSQHVYPFLKTYKSLSGNDFPPNLQNEVTFNFDLLKTIAEDDPVKAQAYASLYPVDWFIYKDYIKEKFPQIQGSPDLATVKQQIANGNGRLFSVAEVSSTTDPEIRSAMLENLTRTIRGSSVIFQNPARLIVTPEDQKYLSAAIQRLGLISSFQNFLDAPETQREALKKGLFEASREDPLEALNGISTGFERQYDTVRPFLDIIRPHIHEAYQEDRNFSAISFAINGLHNRSKQERFSIVDRFSSAEVLSVIMLARETLYTSSFNGLLDIFFERKKAEGNDLISLSEKDPDFLANLPILTEAVSTYNRWSDLLSQISDQDKILLLDSIIPDNTSQNNDGSPGYAPVTICSFLQGLSPSDPVLEMAESRLIHNYLSSQDDEEKLNIGLIASWYINNAHITPARDHVKFFEKFATDPQYHFPDLESLPTSRLIDSKGRNFQMHIFYNDDDGLYSYQTFQETLKRNGWIESSVNGFTKFFKQENNKNVEILVSPPAFDGDKAKEIKEYVAQQGGKISVLVHRGHSYHVEKSLDQITPDTQLVFLGSCGGQVNLEAVSQKSPDAHVLSTAGTGRRVINNQLFLDISEQMFSESKIDWRKMKEIWTKRAIDNPELSNDYKNYFAPYENCALLFLQKIHDLINAKHDEKSDLRRLFSEATISGGQPAESPIQALRPPVPTIDHATHPGH